MRNCKGSIAWLLVVAVVFSGIFLPMAQAYAFSLGDLLGTANSPGITGKGLVDFLVGLLLGEVMNKVFKNPPGQADNSGNSDGPAALPAAGKREVLGFYAEWWGTDTKSYTSLASNFETIKTIAPFWATLNEDATLTDRGGNDHAGVVKFAHQNNVAVLLLVNNAKQGKDPGAPIHAILANPFLRKKAIDNLESYIKKYNLDGVNIDFEMVAPQDKDNLTAFMAELHARLKPQGYIISIDVFPKQNEDVDVSIAYDYAQLARYADKIIVMTYDHHGMWSGPGPVAGIQWVEANIKYALKNIPRNKLYMGIAAYGYDWSPRGVKSVEYEELKQIQQQYRPVIKWDNIHQTPNFTYSDFQGVNHEVWFENPESLKYKLDLVNKFDLSGIAIWRLGGEDPGYWQVIRDKL